MTDKPFTPPGWALMTFGELMQRAYDAKPCRWLPDTAYVDPQGGGVDPWAFTAVTMTLPKIKVA